MITEYEQHSHYSFLEGQTDGDVCRYDHVRTPCPMGTVVFSHTGSGPGVLKTLALLTGNQPVRLGAGGRDGGHGHEPGKELLTILRRTERQKSS